MTTGTVFSQGTKLYFTDPATSSAIHEVACPTAISGLGGAGSPIDKTCLSSVEMEKVRGMLDPGPMTVPINFIPTSASHQALMDLRESGETCSWQVTAPGVTAPSDVDSNGALVSSGPTTATFFGYVSDFQFEIGTNSIWKGTLTIQRSGPTTWDFPAPTQA